MQCLFVCRVSQTATQSQQCPVWLWFSHMSTHPFHMHARTHSYLRGMSHVPLPPRTTRDKCSALLFCWYRPLLRLAKRRTVTIDDLWHVPSFNQCQNTAPALQKLFDEEVARGRKRPLLWALLRTRLCDFGLTAL